jgi:predicted nucleotidyltransferase component of viral defense system
LDELLGTKLRALYQRRNGRDLFDLWLGLTLGGANPNAVVQTFRKYMEIEGHSVSKKDFKENLRKKMQTKSFLADTDNLLRPTITYDHQEAFRLIDEQLLTLL